ncbi:MAG TPA: YsnF/AvaK domain-containing protein [Flavisolibacter sp.]|nr:YsnF/AvaK domain-containing protein [Flavisolibacter sp.]
MAAQTVIGFFDDQQEAQRAVEQLQSRGISRDRIDVSRNDAGISGASGSTSGNAGVNPVSGSTRDENSIRRTSDDRTVDEGGRNTNKITDFFNNLFGGSDNDDADRYSRVAQNSNTIVTVHAQSEEEAEMAADILDDAGAVNVDERASQLGVSNTRSTEDIGGRQNISNERENTIPIIQENLEVGKREVERGGVRVRSRIVERPVEEHIRLREEHVNVERENVNRPATEADFARAAGQDIEMTERSEQAVVNKQARVVEEVRVSKEATERNETIRDTVRNTDVDVNNLNSGTTGRSGTDTDSDLDDISRRNRGL